MLAILKRDFNAYFNSPVGYIFIAVFTLITGFFFIQNNVLGLSASLSYVFANATIIFIFIVPLLTVKMLTEERKSKTDQILLTAPVTVNEIVFGKYFAALGVFLLTLFVTLIYVVIIAIFGAPAFGEIITLYIGVFLMGATFIAVGLYISSLTDNQFIGVILSFGVLLIMYLLNSVIDFIPWPFAKSVLNWFAITSRFSDFASGLLGLESVVYYISVCAVFLVLTKFSVEKRRWR